MPPKSRAQVELQELLDAARTRHRVPGAAVGVLVGDRELVATSGVTSVDNPLTVDDTTLFMVGSTTKTFTATALMRLADMRELSLDDTVITHLPEFRLGDKAATRALTLRHLVTHTGGWDGDIDLDAGWRDDALARYVDALHKQPQDFAPGAMWAYNNAGFCVLGRVIEVVTGMAYETAVADLLLRPLGMEHSFFSPVDALTRRFAVGHASGGRTPQVVHTLGITRSLAPAGGLISTVRDQLTWARFHLGGGRSRDGARILKAKTMRLMQSNLAPAGTMADHVGVSWLISDAPVRTVAHGGNVSNLQLSTFAIVPERDFAVTVLTNAGNGRLLGREVERWALQRFTGAVETPPVFADIDPNDLKQYEGTYTSRLSELEVVARGRRLLLTSRFNVDTLPESERETLRALLAVKPKPVELGLVAPDRAVVSRGPSLGVRGEFLRESPNGPVCWMRWGGRVHRRQVSRR